MQRRLLQHLLVAVLMVLTMRREVTAKGPVLFDRDLQQVVNTFGFMVSRSNRRTDTFFFQSFVFLSVVCWTVVFILFSCLNWRSVFCLLMPCLDQGTFIKLSYFNCRQICLAVFVFFSCSNCCVHYICLYFIVYFLFSLDFVSCFEWFQMRYNCLFQWHHPISVFCVAVLVWLLLIYCHVWIFSQNKIVLFVMLSCLLCFCVVMFL